MRTTALVASCALAACSSQYVPQARGHVAMTIRDGKYVYVRDGNTYEHGLLGGGLVGAVQGNPAAVAAATEYHSHMKTGFIAVLLGSLVSLGGIVYTTASIAGDRTDNNTGTNAAIGLSAMIGGLIVMSIGSIYLAGAEPYRWDAINLFNDGADMQQSGPPGYAPQAKATLKMRD
jgi:hypothetical protein